jgi:hypothetical protein
MIYRREEEPPTQQDGVSRLAGLERGIRQRLAGRVDGASAELVRVDVEASVGCLLEVLQDPHGLVDDLGT